MNIKPLLILTLALSLLSACGPEKPKEPTLKIGGIYAYTTWATLANKYREGFELAIKDVNDKGGIHGRKIEVLWRDDKANPSVSSTVATELRLRDKVDFFVGCQFSNLSLAMSDYAKHYKIAYLGIGMADSLTLEKGTPYNFSVQNQSYNTAAIVAELVKNWKGRRLALIAPNYESGHAMAKALKTAIAKEVPDAVWIAEQYPALGRLEAGPTVMALKKDNPDIVINHLFSSDLAAFVREGRKRGLFSGRKVIGLVAGDVENIEMLGDENPTEFAAVLGYPGTVIHMQSHEKFVAHYRKVYGTDPYLGSLLGYNAGLFVIAALQKLSPEDLTSENGHVNQEKLIKALEGAVIDSPVGKLEMRAMDHRSTLGTWVGRLDKVDGKWQMVDFEYKGGDKYLPPKEMVERLRPKVQP